MNALTRDPELNFFLAVGVLWVAWWGLLFWRVRLRRKLFGSEKAGASTLGGVELIQGLAYASLFGPLVLPLLALINRFARSTLFHISPPDFWLTFGALYLFFLMNAILGVVIEFREEARLFNRPIKARELWHTIRLHVPFSFLTFLIWRLGLPFLTGQPVPWTELIIWFYGGLIAFIFITRWLVKGTPGIKAPPAGIELEDSPLRAEILALARQVGVQVKSIKLMPPPPQSRSGEEPLIQLGVRRSMWWNALDPASPTIPSDLIRGMAASTFTAGMASLYVRSEFNRGVFDRLPVFRKLSPRARKFFRNMLIILSLMALVGTGFFSMIATNIWAYGAYVAVLALFVVFLIYRLRMRRKGRSMQTLHRVVEIWREAEPHSSRTVHDYLSEIILFNAALNPNIPHEQLLSFTLRIESTRAYMNTLDAETREDLRARMESALSEGTS